MLFTPYVVQRIGGQTISVEIVPASQADLAMTRGEPVWQTDWGSAYLSDAAVKKYAMKTPDGELIALGAYQITGRKAYVYILYAESAPHSNPTLVKENRKYYGIGAALIAFGIKFSIDNGCRGDVVFEAKTDELAKHYAEDFHAKRIPSVSSGGPKRFMLADEDAWALFSRYLSEEE
jgi:hypothetical protein